MLAYKSVLLILVFFSTGVFAQQHKPLSVTDIELLVKDVSPKRVAELIEELGVNFEVTKEIRERLRKAGADTRSMQVVEREGVEFGKKKLEEMLHKMEEEKRRLEEERRKVEQEKRDIEEERRKIEEARYTGIWEKLRWEEAPKDKRGKPHSADAVAIAGKNDVYFAFGGSHLIHWDGKAFKEIEHEMTGDKKWDLRNFVINSKEDIWVFGDGGLSLHYDGSKWRVIKNPLLGEKRKRGRLWGSGCAEPNRCFAGSRNGKLIEWDGKEWKEIKSPADGSRIYTIQFPFKNSGWMAGEAFFARWDGREWKRIGIDAPQIYDMTILSNDFGWAVGDGGVFFKYDGKTWARVDVKDSFIRLRGVSCSSRNDCWAVGDTGAAFYWNGKKWKRVKLATSERFSSVRLGHGHGFIVGHKGTIFKLSAGY